MIEALETRGEFCISNRREDVPVTFVHEYLSQESYWARHIGRERVERLISASECFSLFKANKPIGFGRALTDDSVIAYVSDAFVVEPERGQGLATWLMKVTMTHEPLQGVGRWMLRTKDARPLYRELGFSDLSTPERFMEKLTTQVYEDERGTGRKSWR